MPGSLVLTNSKEFEKWAENEIMNQVYNRFLAGKAIIRSGVQALVEKELSKSNEFNSILGGALHKHFGIPSPAESIKRISSALLDSVVVIGNRTINQVTIFIGVLRNDFSELLTSGGGSYIYDAKPKVLPSGRNLAGGSVEINWLDWLLFAGDKIVIVDADIRFKSTGRSRSGGAIMVHKKNPVGWHVPSEFSGVKDDNWMTRVLLPLQSSVYDIIYQWMNI